MNRALARQADAEREKRAKIINSEGRVPARRRARGCLRHHDGPPLSLQLRNLQSPVEIGVDKNTTVVFRAPLMRTIEEIGSFLARETPPPPPTAPNGDKPAPVAAVNGAPESR
jgi:hypothetical protein